MKSFAVLALAVILAPAALAQHQTFAINPDASEVKITLKTTHEVVNGTFHIQSGSIEFDPGAPEMSGSVVVLAGSGKTGNGSSRQEDEQGHPRGRPVRNRLLCAEDLYRRHRSFRRLDHPGNRNLHPARVRRTRSPSPCLSISKVQPQRSNLASLFRTSNGD